MTRWFLAMIVTSLSAPAAFAQESRGVIFVDPLPLKQAPASQAQPKPYKAPLTSQKEQPDQKKMVSVTALITQGTLIGTGLGVTGLVIGGVGGFALSSQRQGSPFDQATNRARANAALDHTIPIVVSAFGVGTMGLVSGVGIAASMNRGYCSIWGRVAGGGLGLLMAGIIAQGSSVVGAFMPGLGASIGCYQTFKLELQ